MEQEPPNLMQCQVIDSKDELIRRAMKREVAVKPTGMNVDPVLLREAKTDLKQALHLLKQMGFGVTTTGLDDEDFYGCFITIYDPTREEPEEVVAARQAKTAADE